VARPGADRRAPPLPAAGVWVRIAQFNGDRGSGLALWAWKVEGGPAVLYEASVADRGSQTGWNGFWRIECEQGALQYRGQDVEIARFDAQQPEPVPLADLPAQGQHEVLRQFTSALAGGPAPETVGRDNLKSLAAVFAALESARSGRPKRLRELLG